MIADPPTRVFRHHRVLRLNMSAYTHAIGLLGEAAAHAEPISAVIGIANGGLTPARNLAELLGVPTYQVDARHNATDALYSAATGNVTHDLTTLAHQLGGRQLGGTVLVVDDICGTGATFLTITSALRPHLSTKATVITVALCRNAGACIDPDLWVWTVDDWVCFPWEPAPPAGTEVEDLPVPDQVESR